MKRWTIIVLVAACMPLLHAQTTDSLRTHVRICLGLNAMAMARQPQLPAGMDLVERSYLPGPSAGLAIHIRLHHPWYLQLGIRYQDHSLRKQYFGSALKARFPEYELHLPPVYFRDQKERTDLRGPQYGCLYASLAYKIERSRATWLPMFTVGAQLGGAVSYKYVLRVPQTNSFTEYSVHGKARASMYYGIGCDWMINQRRDAGIGIVLGYTQMQQRYTTTVQNWHAEPVTFQRSPWSRQWIVALQFVAYSLDREVNE